MVRLIRRGCLFQRNRAEAAGLFSSARLHSRCFSNLRRHGSSVRSGNGDSRHQVQRPDADSGQPHRDSIRIQFDDTVSTHRGDTGWCERLCTHERCTLASHHRQSIRRAAPRHRPRSVRVARRRPVSLRGALFHPCATHKMVPSATWRSRAGAKRARGATKRGSPSRQERPRRVSSCKCRS
jgi:hypothetical protein